MNGGDCAERIEDIAHGRCDVESVQRQRPRVVKLAHEEVEPLVLVPLRIGADAERPGDGVERLSVTVGFLPDVEAGQDDAEDRHAAKQVGQPSGGDAGVALLDQRVMAEPQRLRQSRRLQIDIRRRIRWLLAAKRILDPRACRQQS